MSDGSHSSLRGRGVIVTAVLVTALALAATVEARNYGGGNLVAFSLKAYKNKFKEFDVGTIPMKCDEGTTDTGNSSANAVRYRWKTPPLPSVKRDRRFRIVKEKSERYPVIDENANLVGIEKDEFVLHAKGRFNRAFTKAHGTVRITGSYRGPDPNGPPGSMIQYHHCDTGVLDWNAHKTGFRR
jgi:hypothetical protein